MQTKPQPTQFVSFGRENQSVFFYVFVSFFILLENIIHFHYVYSIYRWRDEKHIDLLLFNDVYYHQNLYEGGQNSVESWKLM